MRVCRTRFVDGEEIDQGVYRLDGKLGKSTDNNEHLSDNDVNNKIDRRFGDRDKRSKIDKHDGMSENKNGKDENVPGKKNLSISPNNLKANISAGDGHKNTINNGKHSDQLNVKLTADGLVKEANGQSTADIETYDAKMRKEIASEFGQSREFFDRLRNILNKNRTFQEDEKDAELNRMVDRIPLTSLEINVTESDDELKKVQMCTCPACGHAKSRGRAIFGSDSRDRDLAKVELLNINYREFLRGSMFERHLTALDGNIGREKSQVGNGEYTKDNANHIESNQNTDKQSIGAQKDTFGKGGSPGTDMNTNENDSKNGYDLNFVKLLLLWKFGNSLVLLDDQATLLHSNLIDKGRVNLGYHLIYSPYECASVIFNMMREYERGGKMSKAIGEVYRVFCKKAPRGFCNAIRYVQIKRV